MPTRQERFSPEDKADLLRLFSKLSSQIHRLSRAQAQVLVDVDSHMSRDLLGPPDLEHLREIDQAREADQARS